MRAFLAAPTLAKREEKGVTVSLVQQFSVTPRKLTEFMALVTEGSAMGEKAGGSIRWPPNVPEGSRFSPYCQMAETIFLVDASNNI